VSERDDADVVVVPPAPDEVARELAERAAEAFDGRRTMTLVGGFGLAALREAARAQREGGGGFDSDHLPFPLVRRLDRRSDTEGRQP
jgi:hypothetical protein